MTNVLINYFTYLSGEILRNDVVATLPFRNTLTQVELKGSDLIRVFEYSVEGLGTDRLTGRFLQVSGKIAWLFANFLELFCTLQLKEFGHK